MYTPPSNDSRTMAALCHLLAMFTGFVGPLIMYLVKEDDEFVRFHALQAVYFQLIGILLAMLTCGIWGIVMFIYEIILIIKAYDGEWYEYPIVGSWARR